MITKCNLFAGGVIALLTVSAFTMGRGLGRKSKTDWNAEHWLRLLSDANGIVPTQAGQASQLVSKPEISGRAGYQLNIGALQAYQSAVSQPSVAAEITGRTDYPLYRL